MAQQLVEVMLLSPACNFAIVEKKDKIGRLIFEFILDLNGSRTISAAGIEDRDRSPIGEGDIVPVMSSDRKIACLGRMARTKKGSNDLPQRQGARAHKKKTWRPLLEE